MPAFKGQNEEKWRLKLEMYQESVKTWRVREEVFQGRGSMNYANAADGSGEIGIRT